MLCKKLHKEFLWLGDSKLWVTWLMEHKVLISSFTTTLFYSCSVYVYPCRTHFNINIGAKSIESACHFTTEVFRENNMDIPYAIIYLVENEKVGSEFKPKNARLEATTFDRDLTAIKGPDGTEEYQFVHGQSRRDLPEVLPKTPELIDLTDAETSDSNMVENNREIPASEPWPLALAVFKNDNVTIKLSDNSLAVLCPVITTSAGKSFLTALMICGISKHRALDREYEEFLHV